MGFEEKVAESFRKAKEDAEGMKNEIAFAMRRIAKIEEVLNRMAVTGQLDKPKRKRKKY